MMARRGRIGAVLSAGSSRSGPTDCKRKRRHFRRFHSATKARNDDVYSLLEVMRLYGVDEQTVRNWLRQGLVRVAGVSRILVRGDGLNRFHAARNHAAKQPLSLTQFYCMTCHAPSDPVVGSVCGANPFAPSLRLEAKCSTCGNTMYRSYSRDAASALAARSELLADLTPPAVAQAPAAARIPRPDDTARDSLIPPVSPHRQKPDRTPEGADYTIESDQLSLPFGFTETDRAHK